MAKVFLACIGKYLTNSGAESIWTENSVFGINVVQSVLGGSNYVRSFKGMLLLCEAMERLQWNEFFNVNGVENYSEELNLLSNLKTSVSEKERHKSQQILDAFIEKSDKMLADFNDFREESVAKSETFKYWDTFVTMVSLLRDLIRADREGNWHLHMNTVQSMLPHFAIFDRVNYLRWCSMYLEDMRRLPETSPSIHESFEAGKFVIKRTGGHFSAVGATNVWSRSLIVHRRAVGDR